MTEFRRSSCVHVVDVEGQLAHVLTKSQAPIPLENDSLGRFRLPDDEGRRARKSSGKLGHAIVIIERKHLSAGGPRASTVVSRNCRMLPTQALERSQIGEGLRQCPHRMVRQIELDESRVVPQPEPRASVI